MIKNAKTLTLDDLRSVRGGLADAGKKWVKSEEEGKRGDCTCKVEYEKAASAIDDGPVGF